MQQGSVIQGSFPGGVIRLAAHTQFSGHRATSPATAVPLPAHLARFPRTPGQPLPVAVRQRMEAVFGASFADVRVHVGPQAAALGAHAFTHGTQIYFAPGQYDPSTPRGAQILGHELAHVVQQRAGRIRNPFGFGIAVVHDPLVEAEAARMAIRAAMQFRLPPGRQPVGTFRPGHPHGPRVLQRKLTAPDCAKIGAWIFKNGKSVDETAILQAIQALKAVLSNDASLEKPGADEKSSEVPKIITAWDTAKKAALTSSECAAIAEWYLFNVGPGKKRSDLSKAGRIRAAIEGAKVSHTWDEVFAAFDDVFRAYEALNKDPKLVKEAEANVAKLREERVKAATLRSEQEAKAALAKKELQDKEKAEKTKAALAIAAEKAKQEAAAAAKAKAEKDAALDSSAIAAFLSNRNATQVFNEYVKYIEAKDVVASGKKQSSYDIAPNYLRVYTFSGIEIGEIHIHWIYAGNSKKATPSGKIYFKKKGDEYDVGVEYKADVDSVIAKRLLPLQSNEKWA